MEEQPGVIVVFRMQKSGAVIALFPEVEAVPRLAGMKTSDCLSFEHVGQHGAADYAGIIASTRPATPEEYKALKRELENAPYFYALSVRQRRPSRHRRGEP